MKVTRGQIISRCLARRCPNCGGPAIFVPEARFRVKAQCEACGAKLDRGEGFFLGPWVINYTVTVACLVVPVILLGVRGVLGQTTTFLLAGAAALGGPILLYRRSWGWWLLAYFYFLPHKLPANRDAEHEDDEE